MNRLMGVRKDALLYYLKRRKNMSQVPKEKRTQSKLECLIKARKLCNYSLKILANNKNFKTRPSDDEKDDEINPPQPELVAKLRETVLDIYMSAYSANETYLNKDNYRHRRQLQDKSISKCSELLALIELSRPIFHIPYKRVEYWGGLTLLVRNLLSSWKDGDYKRYKRL